MFIKTVANTAFYCCGIRAADATSAFSLVGDRYAQLFMDERGRAIFAPFVDLTMPNLTNVTRCRIIDDWIRDVLGRAPDTRIITLGAGFDSRPFRMTGGRWVELDEPSVIALKQDRLPAAECPNPLQRVAIAFDREPLAETLMALAGETAPVVVVEGVFMYFTEDVVAGTLKALGRAFPEHVLVCDLMNRAFFVQFSREIHERLAAAGGTIAERPEHPERTLADLGYRQLECIPMFRRARQFGALAAIARMPNAVAWLATLFRPALNGYAAYRFHYPDRR